MHIYWRLYETIIGPYISNLKYKSFIENTISYLKVQYVIKLITTISNNTLNQIRIINFNLRKIKIYQFH